jgi:hypothetical protein
MGLRLIRFGVLGLAFVAATLSVSVSDASVRRDSAAAGAYPPLRLGCPSQRERVGIVGASFNIVVTTAQRVLYGETAHYQGRSERRTATNTPVVAVVTELGSLNPVRVEGQRQLLAEATKLCGGHTANFSSAVMFDDSLSPVCCLPPITLFVVRTDRSLRVYPRLRH